MAREQHEPGYSDFDRERFFVEQRELPIRRGEFARDRARVLHSSALRRLGAKTQVLSPGKSDFARTRLTHSLEVAQIGREMARDLGLDPDLVDMACLAHDLGHPPFGHNGEKALNDWAENIGGFEGNAQTLRLLTRIEPKVFVGSRPYGLNLTRASLDAACKYPWAKGEGSQPSSPKFGVYQDDLPVFEWLRRGAPQLTKCIEAQVMDFSDDVAYSVHDFEDAIVSDFIDVERLSDSGYRAELITEIIDWSAGAFGFDEIDEALARLERNAYWPSAFTKDPQSLGALKNLTSSLIGSFVGATTVATLQNQNHDVTRYAAALMVPRTVETEIAVLKGIVSAFLMSTASRRPFYEWQRALLIELADTLLASNGAHLDSASAAAWSRAESEAEEHRIIVDMVACLTDQSALDLHNAIVTKAQ